jgi:general secretion pathway protein H
MVNLELKTASKRVAASLRYARSQATSQQEVYRVVFDFSRNLLTVLRHQESGTMEDRQAQEEKEDGAKEYDLPDGVTIERADLGEKDIESGYFSIFFLPNGSSSGGSITLSNERGRSYTVQVDYITGIVKLT